MVDEYTRECLAIDVAGSIRSKRVIDVLSQFISVHGAPRYLRSDNRPEFVSLAMEWFRNRLEAKVIIQHWRRHYNEIRPHSSLNYRTPAEFIAGLKNDLSAETKKSN